MSVTDVTSNLDVDIKTFKSDVRHFSLTNPRPN